MFSLIMVVSMEGGGGGSSGRCCCCCCCCDGCRGKIGNIIIIVIIIIIIRIIVIVFVVIVVIVVKMTGSSFEKSIQGIVIRRLYNHVIIVDGVSGITGYIVNVIHVVVHVHIIVVMDHGQVGEWSDGGATGVVTR